MTEQTRDVSLRELALRAVAPEAIGDRLLTNCRGRVHKLELVYG